MDNIWVTNDFIQNYIAIGNKELIAENRIEANNIKNNLDLDSLLDLLPLSDEDKQTINNENLSPKGISIVQYGMFADKDRINNKKRKREENEEINDTEISKPLNKKPNNN